jgi:hypothetical protein
MKQQYTLLDKEYSAESLCDIDRDVYEIHQFPVDPEYKLIKNPVEPDFISGTYKVTIVYVPGEDDVIDV